jgi:hypothetical protein
MIALQVGVCLWMQPRSFRPKTYQYISGNNSRKPVHAASIHLFIRTIDSNTHFCVRHLRCLDVILPWYLPSPLVQPDFHVRRPSAISTDVVKRRAHPIPINYFLAISPNFHEPAVVVSVSDKHQSASFDCAIRPAAVEPQSQQSQQQCVRMVAKPRLRRLVRVVCHAKVRMKYSAGLLSMIR